MSQRANTSNPPTPPIELQRTGSGHQLDGENFETTADVNQARNGGNQQLAPVDGGIAAVIFSLNTDSLLLNIIPTSI